MYHNYHLDSYLWSIAMALYTVTNYQVSSILSWIQSGEIAIPEIQRPFVWSGSKVRDLIDSLYWGYPVGYLIIWKNHSVTLKDGSIAGGKKILIDGQQRITALRAAISGLPVIDENYREKNILIAFNPQTEKFEVGNAAIQKDKAWILNISEIFKPSFSARRFLDKYCNDNKINDVDLIDKLDKRLTKLRQIETNTLGSIELNDKLDIDQVTEIFIRINSQGKHLSQADFVMSKIAADSDNGGRVIRKTIDYFCHLLEKPGDLSNFNKNDSEFMRSPEGKAIVWATKNRQELFSPKYDDVLRIAFTFKFQLGKLAQLVGKLSGRNYSERTYDQQTVIDSFSLLHDAVLDVVNKSNFDRFIMIIKAAGFRKASMIRARLAIVFAYSLYLYLKDKKIKPAEIEKTVRRWFVLSLLTERYTSSSETAIEHDIRLFSDALDKGKKPLEVLSEVEQTKLNNDFWTISLPDQLRASTRTNTAFCIFLAAQVKTQSLAFLSSDIGVTELIEEHGDVHHLFPKQYLIKHGLKQKEYNQVANFALTQTEINIHIRDRSPKDYMAEVLRQIKNQSTSLGGITNRQLLNANLKANAIPTDFDSMEISDYQNFLSQRRKLMAKMIKDYYTSL